MLRGGARQRRKGAFLPLTVVCLVPMIAMIVLAIDVGMMLAARSQCQVAADAAALAGARALDGSTSPSNPNNYDGALNYARLAVQNARILNAPADPLKNLKTVNIGSFTYNHSLERFEVRIPRDPNDSYNLVQTQVVVYDPATNREEAELGFARFRSPGGSTRVFGIDVFTTGAWATAVHRPRDVLVVIDFSGSMRYDSLLGIPHNGTRDARQGGENSGSNNPEAVFPQFGHYSAVTTAGLRRTGGMTATSSGDDTYGECNITVPTTLSGPPIVEDFDQNPNGSARVRAFSPPDVSLPPDAFYLNPGGDRPLMNGSTFVKNLNELPGAPASPNSFYDSTSSNPNAPFKGYTRGPRYWGRTFFIWPPYDGGDYTNTSNSNRFKDWRFRFFNSTLVNGKPDNTKFFGTNGQWLAPSPTTYQINYQAIINWIRNPGIGNSASSYTAPTSMTTPANPDPYPLFPERLRAGRILYYDNLSTSPPWSGWNPSANPTDPNERFWKKYIDYVLGVYQDPSTGTYSVITGETGYGVDYTWGTATTSAPPTTGYMNKADNPRRPRLHFWFGPMTMIDFLGSHNRGNSLSRREHYWWPGTCHEAPCWQLKAGMQAVLESIRLNHPSDYVGLIYYSNPKLSNTDTSGGPRFNDAVVPLGRDYERLKQSLWFSPLSVSSNAVTGNGPVTEYRYDYSNAPGIASWSSSSPTDPARLARQLEVPRGMGQTTPAMGLMIAYNQFASDRSNMLWTYGSPPSGQEGYNGGNGRRGARKMIVFETDGRPTQYASAGFVSSGGPYKSYYQIRVNPAETSGEFPGTSGTNYYTQVYDIVDRIVAEDTTTASPGPGYRRGGRNVLIHCLAFGSMFEPNSTDPNKGPALTMLGEIQARGGLPNPIEDWKHIVAGPGGDYNTKIDKIRDAFNRIMQDGIQVSLLY